MAQASGAAMNEPKSPPCRGGLFSEWIPPVYADFYWQDCVVIRGPYPYLTAKFKWLVNIDVATSTGPHRLSMAAITVTFPLVEGARRRGGWEGMKFRIRRVPGKSCMRPYEVDILNEPIQSSRDPEGRSPTGQRQPLVAPAIPVGS
jgi:hypothetical protein